MNRRQLPVAVVFAVLAIAGATHVFACSDSKTTSASNASGKSAKVASAGGECTAAMAAACTPEMAAACKANGKKGTKASAAMVTASAGDHCASKGTKASAAMVTADAGDHCASKGASAASAKKVNATAASASCCATKGAKTSAASTKAAAVTTPTGFDATVAGSGASCSGKGVGATAGMSSGHDCDACADMAMCDTELKSAGAQYQVVPLKNGVMYVYTADGARDVRAVQAAISRRADRVQSLVSADKAKLCPECRQLRGAMASGKLVREVVNVEGGSISLVTSSDPSVVARLYAMAGLSGQKVVKG